MKRSAAILAFGAVLVCSGCASFWERLTASDTMVPFRDYAQAEEVTATASMWERPGVYGGESDVRGTVDIVKAAGEVSQLGSHAIRLPSNPLQTITAFDYEFPDVCGGHHFRVYEADGTQILEYDYVPTGGRPYVIRDYISGPHPFIRAGLWTAYDHTGDSVSEMRVQFAKRGSGILTGTYSQGPVTGLDASSRRALGTAYDRALRESHACRA